MRCTCSGSGAGIQVLEGLARLLDSCLVERDGTRWRFLETVRQYAAEKLRDRGDDAIVARRHAEWCLALAEAARPELTGPAQQHWLDQLEVENATCCCMNPLARQSGSASSKPIRNRARLAPSSCQSSRSQ